MGTDLLPCRYHAAKVNLRMDKTNLQMDDRFEIVHIYRCCVMQTFSDGRNIDNWIGNWMRGSLTTTTNQSTSEWLDVKQMVNLEVTGGLDGKRISCSLIHSLNTTRGTVINEEGPSASVTFFVRGLYLLWIL